MQLKIIVVLFNQQKSIVVWFEKLKALNQFLWSGWKLTKHEVNDNSEEKWSIDVTG